MSWRDNTAVLGNPAAPVLEVDGLGVKYGEVTALEGMSMRVANHEAVFVAGSNGAGKTSLLRAISGLERAAAGSIRLMGREIANAKPWDIARLGIAHVPQGRRCFGPISVEDNLLLGGYVRRKSEAKEGLELVYSIFPILAEKRSQLSSQLSGGQQQMVAVGRALMARPRLVMLDEPSLGLSPLMVDNLGDALIRMKEELDGAVLLVEQNVQLALRVAARGYVLQTGRLLREGAGAELEGGMRDAYLGAAK